jgi:hypothetical protein
LVNETKATQITDTIVFHHKNITNPSVSKADAIVAGASELTTATKGNLKEDVTKMDLKELERLAQNFEAAAKKVSEANAGSQRVVQDDAEAPPPLQQVEDDNEANTLEGAESLRVANDTVKDPKHNAMAPRVASANNRERRDCSYQLPTLRRSRPLNTNITTTTTLWQAISKAILM